MSGWTANRVVSLLLRLAEELQALDAELVGLELDSVTKAEALNLKHSQALIKTEGPQYYRVAVAVADAASAEERLASKLADVMVRGAKRKVEILRSRIDIGRTVAASLRSELELEKAPWR
jgi:cytochrome c551/c552